MPGQSVAKDVTLAQVGALGRRGFANACSRRRNDSGFRLQGWWWPQIFLRALVATAHTELVNSPQIVSRIS